MIKNNNVPQCSSRSEGEKSGTPVELWKDNLLTKLTSKTLWLDITLELN